tara:strand:- start:28842 stop:31421 length:2580 start_codon:yes stop_codon:yes gene_type:complete
MLITTTCSLSIFAQVESVNDSSYVSTDILLEDSLKIASDSISNNLTDSLITSEDTSKNNTTISPDAIENKVVYEATDSLLIDMSTEKIFLYKNAKVVQENTTLTADFIELDLRSNLVTANGMPDSSGKMAGLPVFQDGPQEFRAGEMNYNFETKKGKIAEVKTQEGEGFIKGNEVKKTETNVMYIRNGHYTTCNLDHPHFSLATNKLKVIPNEKIITGPTVLKLGEVPTPLGLPFGLFPNKKGRSSGILIPTYGDSRQFGFFLRDGGFYFGLSDYMDLSLTGDVYSLGSWGGKLNSNYRNRYKYSGNVNITFTKFKNSFPDFPDYSESNEFFLSWRHSQDPKSRPGSRFAADVSAGSRNNFRNNLNSFDQNFLTNTFQSSITYSNSFPTKPFNLTLSARHNQNTQTGDVNLTLPDATFNVSRLQPFKTMGKIGNEWWRSAYRNLGVSYSGSVSNQIRTVDSLFTLDRVVKDFQVGARHVIPLATSFKLFKYATVNPSFNYSEVWALETVRKTIDRETNQQVRDTLVGFERGGSYNFNTALTTKFYSMYQFKRGKVKAIRHVMTPSISYNYQPEITTGLRTIRDTTGKEIEYSIFEGGLNGSPSRRESGRIGFNLLNNLEMKVASKKDTTGFKKITIFENFVFNSSYDLSADSLNWAPLSFNARSRIGDFFNFQFGGNLDPYAIDSNGRKINTFYKEQEDKYFRLTNANIAMNFSLRGGKGNQRKKKESEHGTEQELDHINAFPEQYVDFTIPWSLNVTYNIRYSKPAFESSVMQTLNFSGDFSLTENWKIGFTSGYDIERKDITYTSININRNLHCWEMAVNWIPYGIRQSYNITINVKASVLQDLKLNRRRDFFDVIQ